MNSERNHGRAFERAVYVYPRVAAALSVLVGIGAIIGWLTGVRTIAGAAVFALPMTANVALMAILCGIALWVIVEPVSRARRRIAIVCACCVCALCVIGVIESLFDTEIGLEQLMPNEVLPPRRMSPQAGLSFLMLALGVLLIDRTWRGRRPADFAALVALATSATALLGYLFGVPEMYQVAAWVPEVGMSLETAVIVYILALGMFAARMRQSIVGVAVVADRGGVAARQLLAGLAMLVPVAIAVLAGAHARWYSFAFASAIVLLVAIGELSGVIFATANRLSRADAQLAASESRVHVLVDQAADPIFIADSTGRYIQVNDAACRLLGYARADLLGKRLVDLIPPEDGLRVAPMRAALRAGGSHTSDWRLRRRDGSLVPVEVSAKVFSDGRWQGIVRDVSERKRGEAALARAAEIERNLRAELEALIGAVSHTVGELPRSDVDAVLRAVAEQARVLTGATGAGAAIEDRWVSIGLADEVAQALRELPASAEIRYELPQARPPTRSILAVPIRGRSGTHGTLFLVDKASGEFSEHDAQIVGALSDRIAPAIETAMMYETEARTRAWLTSIIDQLPEGVLVVDDRGDVRAVNRVMLGLVPDAGPRAIDTEIYDAERHPVPFDDRPIVRALRHGEAVHDVELTLRHSNDRFLPISASAGPIRDERGRITGAVVVVTDITERKEAERTHEEWIAVIAHDLRQPLNTILLSGDRIKQLATDEHQRAALQRIERASWRLNRMVEDLLDAARIAANRLSIEPRTTDLVEVARRVLDNARLEHPSSELRLLAASRELTWSDGDRIEQVLGNLVSNAIKYGTPGSPVRLEIVGADLMVEVAVINEGPPLPRETLDRLFTRFARAAEARTAHIPGIGLGLYISKGLVEAHGGRIWVRSERGTTAFRFTLPRPPE